MTKNSFSKSATRARMAETGEPYSVAARALSESSPRAREDEKADFAELIILCERLAVFLEPSLMTFENAMQLVLPYTEDEVLREAIEFVLEASAKGNRLPDAVDLRPNAFRSVFPELLRMSFDGNQEAAKMLRSMAKMYRTELEMEERSLKREEASYIYR